MDGLVSLIDLCRIASIGVGLSVCLASPIGAAAVLRAPNVLIELLGADMTTCPSRGATWHQQPGVTCHFGRPTRGAK